MIMKTSRISVLAIATLLTCGSFARAESPLHLDELAATAERQARRVLYQTYSLHAYGPAARQLKDDAFHMIRLAKHVHDVAHVDHRLDGGRHRHPVDQIDRQVHLARDAAELDRLMHEMQDLVAQMNAHSAPRTPHYGRYAPGHVGISVGRNISFSFNGRGTSHGHHGRHYRAPSPLDQIERSLASLSETVHHLLDDVSVVCVRSR